MGQDRKTERLTSEVGTRESGRAERGPERGRKDMTVPKPSSLKPSQLHPSRPKVRTPNYQGPPSTREPTWVSIHTAAGSVRGSFDTSGFQGPGDNRVEAKS